MLVTHAEMKALVPFPFLGSIRLLGFEEAMPKLKQRGRGRVGLLCRFPPTKSSEHRLHIWRLGVDGSYILSAQENGVSFVYH